MKKVYNIFLMAVAVVMLAACSNEDNFTQKPDEFFEISFDMASQMLTSKADADGCKDYRDWNLTQDPTDMGVFGYTNIPAAPTGELSGVDNEFFSNTEVSYAESKWSYSPLKYWADYTWADTYDFFAYMPHVEGAKVSKSGSDYTLSVPVSLSTDKGILKSAAATPLICREPNHQTKTGNVIKYHMDQTLTGYALQFKLGDKMGDLRDFIVKKVEIFGTMPGEGGTVSRTYTLASNGSWTAGDITWDVTTAAPIDEEHAVNIAPYDAGNGNPTGNSALDKYYDTYQNMVLDVNMSDADKTKKVMRVTKYDAVQWGDVFYTIPSVAGFHPTIKVTYDVVLTYDGEMSSYLRNPGDYESQTIEDTKVLTRKDVVSTIEFAPQYFTTTPEPGKKNTILINIVPKFLYVMADEDQTQKYVTITTK